MASLMVLYYVRWMLWGFIQVAIPHEEGLEALKGVLEHREDKTISTDTLLELAHVVLKNNFFEFNGDFYQQLRGTPRGGLPISK